jgi:hypothetical protein
LWLICCILHNILFSEISSSHVGEDVFCDPFGFWRRAFLEVITKISNERVASTFRVKANVDNDMSRLLGEEGGNWELGKMEE